MSNPIKWVMGVLIVAVALVACGAFPGNASNVPTSASSIPTSGRVRGQPDAKITLVEYSDFQ